MSYEPKCHVLAEQFLSDESGELQRKSTELAQAIQDAIEDWIQYEKLPYCELCGDEKACMQLDGKDSTPTDRGDLITHYKLDVCSKCWAKHDKTEVF